MPSRAPLRFALITLSLASLVWLFPTAAPAEMRHAGTVLMMDGSAGTLTLEEYWINGQRRVLKVRITPDTQLVLSERNEMFQGADRHVHHDADSRGRPHDRGLCRGRACRDGSG